MWRLPGLFRSEEELGKTDVKVCCFTRAAIEHRSAFVIEPDVTIKRQYSFTLQRFRYPLVSRRFAKALVEFVANPCRDFTEYV
jgi:hypothetical protein